jgi:rhomboid protease GluP
MVIVVAMELEQENTGEGTEEWLAISPEPGEGHTAGVVAPERIRLWALVLEARYIPSCIEQVDTGWQLLVPAEHFAAAKEELLLFEEENRDWPPAVPLSRPLVENTPTGVTLAMLTLPVSLTANGGASLLHSPFTPTGCTLSATWQSGGAS